MMCRTLLQRPRGKNHLQQSAHLDLDHLGALPPSTAQQHSPRVITVAIMQQVLGSYSLVILGCLW